MRLAVIGTGYVGLVTATCFAELGHYVTGVDIDEKKIAMLKEGKSPIFEPGLEELIQKGLQSGFLRFTTDLSSSLTDIDIVFSAVATPPGEGAKADLRAVFTVCETVATHAEKEVLFVNKSTVPVGTGRACEEKMDAILKKRGKSFRIPVISNPEFLREGMAVPDTLMPDRIVVGINGNEPALSMMEELYRPITRVGKPLLFMDRESAEIVKYAANSFLATKISFVNMLTEFIERSGGNIRQVAAGMGMDNRIGSKFLHAGIGYGGSCFPKDVKAFIATARENGLAFPILEATDYINRTQRERFFKRIIDALPAKATVCLWGLGFKPRTDDMREAPSLNLIPLLLAKGHTIAAFDPAATRNTKTFFPTEIGYASSPMEAAKGADAVVLLTEWDVFRGIDFKELKKTMKGTELFDGRNIYEPKEVEEAGLKYVGVGMFGY